MKQRRNVAVTVVGLVLSGACIAANPVNDEVWGWFAKCDRPNHVALELTVDGRSVHHSVFPACVTHRSKIDEQVVAFGLASKKSHFGEPPGSKLEVNLWEAGGESNGMILGVSFMSSQRVWLNTLHFVAIDRPSSSTLAKGVVVKTYPVASAESF